MCLFEKVIKLSKNWTRDTKTHISIDPFQPSVAFHIETSHLFRRANQITGFYMKRNTEGKWVSGFNPRHTTDLFYAPWTQ